MFALYRDGKYQMAGSEADITAWIHAHHSYSLAHALKYEGYSMKALASAKRQTKKNPIGDVQSISVDADSQPHKALLKSGWTTSKVEGGKAIMLPPVGANPGCAVCGKAIDPRVGGFSTVIGKRKVSWCRKCDANSAKKGKELCDVLHAKMSPKKNPWARSGEGPGLDIFLTRAQAREMSAPGRDAYPFVKKLMKAPSIAKQLAKIDPSALRAELKGYGAWEDLGDHEENLARLLWLRAGDISERMHARTRSNPGAPENLLEQRVALRRAAELARKKGERVFVVFNAAIGQYEILDRPPMMGRFWEVPVSGGSIKHNPGANWHNRMARTASRLKKEAAQSGKQHTADVLLGAELAHKASAKESIAVGEVVRRIAGNPERYEMFEPGDKVYRIHAYDGTSRAGKPTGAVRTVKEVRDHKPFEGGFTRKGVVVLDDGGWEFPWNLVRAKVVRRIAGNPQGDRAAQKRHLERLKKQELPRAVEEARGAMPFSPAMTYLSQLKSAIRFYERKLGVRSNPGRYGGTPMYRRAEPRGGRVRKGRYKIILFTAVDLQDAVERGEPAKGLVNWASSEKKAKELCRELIALSRGHQGGYSPFVKAGVYDKKLGKPVLRLVRDIRDRKETWKEW